MPYRSNFQSRLYEKALRDNSLPYQVTGANAYFGRREIKDLLGTADEKAASGRGR